MDLSSPGVLEAANIDRKTAGVIGILLFGGWLSSLATGGSGVHGVAVLGGILYWEKNEQAPGRFFLRQSLGTKDIFVLDIYFLQS
jgi:hypothetical protein